MKKFFLIFVILVLSGILGGGAYYYLSKPRVVSSYTESIFECSSPDVRNYYQKGEVTFQQNMDAGISTMPDYCDYYKDEKYAQKGLLRQSYCTNNQLVTENIDCGIDSVCRQGRCYSGHIGEGSQMQSWPICADTDGGKDTSTRGWVEGVTYGRDECWVSGDAVDPENNGSFTDTCSGSDCYVYEYFCDSDTTRYEIVASPKGCENGQLSKN